MRTFIEREVNALSASSNQIQDGKLKERKESSSMSNWNRPGEDIRSFFSAVQKLQTQHSKFLVLLKSMIVTNNNHFVAIEIRYQ